MNSIKKYIFPILYKIFLKLFSKKKHAQKIYSPEELHILLIHFGSLQEALSITPLLKVLNTKINSSISLLVNDNNSQAFINNLFVDKLLLIEKGPLRIIKTFIQLNRNKYDVIIDVHENLNKDCSFIMGLLLAKHKVGFAKEDVNLLTHIIFLQNPNKVHIVDRILSLADAFEIYYSKGDLNIIFNPTENAIKIIDEYKIRHDLIHKFNVLVNISGTLGIGNWGTENFKTLLRYFENYNVNVILTASIDDIDEAESLNNKKHLIYYQTEFDLFAALVKSVDFILSADAFIVQLAAAYKIPIFCLFVQHKSSEMINVPYNSDFDFALTEKQNLTDISIGKVLNSFIPYFEYVYEKRND